jgi:Holliday junction resolvase-like predicted endonuclease
MKEKLESTLVGVAGEYLVAGELTLRGFIASITLRNSRGIDIIASNSDGSSSVSIQVKTNSYGK